MKCHSTLKNGKPCPYRAKLEYQGYCGHHKHLNKTIIPETSKEKDERLVLLLVAGGELIELTAKAIEYLPAMIEVLVQSRFVGFMKETQVELKAAQENAATMDNQVKFRLSPKRLSKTISDTLENIDLQDLTNFLAYDFDVQTTSGEVPSKLLAEIFEKKQELQSLLAGNGYKPGAHTAHRPVLLQVVAR